MCQELDQTGDYSSREKRSTPSANSGSGINPPAEQHRRRRHIEITLKNESRSDKERPTRKKNMYFNVPSIVKIVKPYVLGAVFIAALAVMQLAASVIVHCVIEVVQ